MEKTRAPFKGRESHATPVCESDHSLSFFPSLPCLRKRGVYSADKEKSTSGCQKNGGRHHALLPGIFTTFCPHGICYGFEVMECAESPNRPFTFLKTRFERAPEIIIYDNACNLHQYALNRDPVFFSHTRMVVDGLHWDNHTACAIGYKGLDYPFIRQINTQIVEQNNAKLKKLKSSLSYMTPVHFLMSLKFFLWHCNFTLKRCSQSGRNNTC
ncbi:hypothetical protein DPMN_104041 [Dreissena polymorpha]|uniref:Transposase n=1 Tax=Dreissena polymorpha TaxID=45954 RepID=A0A9D4HB79_DREPO|nr:hypothetical protein DPMN_104041 [Dreissena polymorpha]